MRLDDVPPRTALHGVLAAWALAVWIAGLVGLGSAIAHLPDDPALRQRLPEAPRPVPERLGPLGQYAEVGSRPLFSEDRTPQPFFINPEGEGEQQNQFDFILTSVLITPRLQMAIIQPTAGGDALRVKVGEAPEESPNWTLVSVQPRQAVFNGPEGERTLELRLFDGAGGEPPTVLRQAGALALPGRVGQTGSNTPNAGRTMPTVPVPGATPAPASGTTTPTAVPPPPPPAQAPDSAEQQQVEAIRKRIEARRTQLREQTEQQAPPAQNP